MGREFNREMGGYLRQRGVFKHTNPFLATKRYLTSLAPKKKKEQEELPLDIPPEQVEQVIAQDAVRHARVMNKPTRTAVKPAVVAVQPQQTKQEQPKVNIIMKWFSKKQEDDDYEMAQPSQPVLDEDVKEVLKITFKWLKAMDPDQVDEIKASEDFEKYKRVLDKYGLIKK